MQTSIEGLSERRKNTSPRIPVELLVELCAADEVGREDRLLDSWGDVSDAFVDSYDADCLDLSSEGLRLRSAVLPDVGQRLRCRFALPELGDACVALGHVVWSNDAGRHGEFGLRFEGLTPTLEAALERWAAARGAAERGGDALEGPTTLPGDARLAQSPRSEPQRSEPQRSERRGELGAGLALVQFDGVSSAIEAEISLRDELRLDVTQALPFFELGRLASVDADGSTERRRLEHVSLRIEDGVPKLVLSFVAEIGSSAGDIAAPSLDDDDAPVSADATLQDEALEDVLARSSVRAAEHRVLETPSQAGAWITDEDESLDEDEGPVVRREARREATHDKKRALFGVGEDSVAEADEGVQARRRKKLDEVRRVLLDGEELPEALPSSAGSEAAQGPAALIAMHAKAQSLLAGAQPSMARLWSAVRAGWLAWTTAAGPRAKAAYAALKGWLAKMRDALGRQLETRAPRLRALLSRDVKEKRRSTAAPSPSVQKMAVSAPRRRQGSAAPAQATESTVSRPRLPLRWVLLAVLVLGAVGSLAYAFGGGPAEPAPIVVPTLAAPEPAMEDELSVESAPIAEEVIAAPAAEAPAPAPARTPASSAATTPSALGAPSTDEGRLPMPGYPSIGRAPSAGSATPTSSASASSTSASTGTATASAAAPISTGRSFGSERVQGGQTTSIRMSLAPSTLEGQANANGFTVTIRGAISRDRVASMARTNPAVDRASVLNRGDHAVLDVRFVEGRSPAYRVEIRGEAVDVTIGR